MKKYIEARTPEELGKILKLPKGESERISMRVGLALEIEKMISKKNLTHAQAGKIAGVGRTVITAIMNGNIFHISTDRLITIAINLGLRVTLKVA